MTRALLDVFSERQRQVNAEGWTPEHDDNHTAGELAAAGAAYAAVAEDLQADRRLLDAGPPAFWPFGRSWWKPADEPRRNLVKAAALILAEIERLDRARGAKPSIVRLLEWCPIEEAEKYDGEYLLYSSNLIDLDFNPSGVVEGHWQDGMGWVGAVWCGCHDVWECRVIEPTHFARKPSVQSAAEEQ